jgi:sialic acid synthase SpsE
MLKELTHHKTFIIAEAGVNHNGDLALAKKLVEAAKDVGADAVKFQTWKTENILVAGTAQAEYQKEAAVQKDQFTMAKELELSFEDFLALTEYAKEVGILLFSTPDDEESAEFLVHRMHVPLLKVGSGELTNVPHLRKMASYQLPLILSTGMSVIEEVRVAVRAIEEVWPNPDLAILQCTSAYPAAPGDVNLRVLETYQREYPHYVIGFSDHTKGILAPALAVALGAKIIEKHFTIDSTLAGPDHQASLDPNDFSRMVQDIRETELLLGSGEKKPTHVELENKKVIERFIVATRDIAQGEILTKDVLAAKRTSQSGGVGASQLSELLGKKTLRPIAVDELVRREDAI